jgi:acyl-CoA synthetase (AMP-forming)/AMP-acid ligase II/acyl carrier protein
MIDHKTLNSALVAQKASDYSITFIEGKQDHRQLTYRELYERAMMLLFDFQEVGLQAGDQVIILHKDNQTFVEAFWACVLGGIVPVPIAVGISDEHKGKLFRVFNKLERPHLFTTEEHLERLVHFADHNHLHESLQVLKSKTILSNLMEDHEHRGRAHTPEQDDMAFIQFSSGSTSEPKGVVLTHRNIMVNLNAIAVGANYSPDDISLSWMPLTHDMGLLGFHLNMIAVGMSQCLMPTDLFSRRPVLWMEKVSELKASVTCSPNFGYKHYLKALKNKSPEGLELSHLRVIYNGAEPISVDLCEQFLEKLKPHGLKREAMFTVYGLAEATLAVAFPKQGEAYRAIYVNRHALLMGDEVRVVEQDHPDAIGFAIEGPPVADMEIKITDDSNASLPENCIGLVQIKGPSVTSGYYLDDEANKQALTGDDWLNTGDLGFLSEQGELVITGREKDIIFSNGLNYYPHDIEAVALQLQELELGKVVAYGVRQAGQDTDQLIVFILYRAEVKDFVGIVRDVMRHINEQTGLQVEQVIPVKRIPKTTSGKLQRRFLGDAYLNGEYDSIIREIEECLAASHAEQQGELSELEYRLKAIFESVVKDKPIDVQDNFFEIGLSSLSLTEIHQEIDNQYSGMLDITDMFEHQSIQELASFLAQKLGQ